MSMGNSKTSELLSVALTSAGLENVLQRLTDRVNDLESSYKAHSQRLERLGEKPATIGTLCDMDSMTDFASQNPEQQMKTLAASLHKLGTNVNQFHKDVKYREAVQQATDTAQDEIMHMKLDRLSRELEVKFTRQDASNMRKLIAVEMRSMREEMEQDFSGRLSGIDDKVSEHLGQVMDQVQRIQESSQSTNELLKDRIQEAFSDIKNASEDMDAKIRKINAMFGVNDGTEDDGTLSYQDMVISLAELRKEADQMRMNVEAQEAVAGNLSNTMGAMQSALEQQIETLNESVHGEFGEGMARVVSDLEGSMAALEGKMEREVMEQLGECDRKLETLMDRINSEEASAEAKGAVQDTLIEHARAQEELLQSTNEDIRASIEKDMDQRFGRVNDEMASLGGVVEQSAESVSASASKINALGTRTKAFATKLAQLETTTSEEIPALKTEIANGLAAMDKTTGGLAHDVRSLADGVRLNKSEFSSHVKSYQTFKQFVSDSQSTLGNASKTIVEGLDLYKTENGYRMVRLERSNVSVVITMRNLMRSLDALATKEGRWDRLEVQSKRHVAVLGGHLAELERDASLTEPFTLAPDMQKHLSAVSQMVAKIIATRADYEVTRQAIKRANPAEDGDWDDKVETLRHRYLDKFVADVVQVASRLRPLPDRPAEEARTVFAKKLELSMKLAISKYKPIQAGATILGKIHLMPACMACDRPFIEKPGPGDQRSVVEDHRGDYRERSAGRGKSRSGSPAGRNGMTPGEGASHGRGQWASGGGVSGGGVNIGGSPVPAYASSSFGGDDDGSVTSITSMASRDSQVSSSTTSRYRSRSGRDRSPHKYVMRSGFKMRQSNSEGGLIANPRIAAGGDGLRLDNGLHCTSGMGDSLSEGEEAGRRGDGPLTRRMDGRPRDHINGSPLELRPSTVSAQAGARQDRGGTRITFQDQEELGGWGEANRVGQMRGGIIDDGEDTVTLPDSDDIRHRGTLAVHLPNLR